MAEGPIAQFELSLLQQTCGDDDFLGVVLAGGRSSRMGHDKASLAYRGRTLLDHQIEKLQRLFGQERVLVSGNYPAHRFLVDEAPGLGPLGGIETIVKMATQELATPSIKNHWPAFFLFVPVDMPLISEKALSRLVQFARHYTRADEGNKISLGGTAHSFGFFGQELPLVLLNHSRMLTTLNKLRNGPKSSRSVRRLCEGLDHKTLNILDIPVIEFSNTNTLAEWREVTDDDSNQQQ